MNIPVPLLLLGNLPGFQGSCGGGDVHPYLDAPAFLFVWNHVAFFVDLLEGFLRRAVHLELEYVGAILCPADGVRSSDGRLDLGLGVVAEEREDKVDDCLVVFLSLVLQIVGGCRP